MHDIRESIIKAFSEMPPIDSAAFMKAFGQTIVISTTEGHRVFHGGRTIGCGDVSGQYAAIADFKRYGLPPEEAAAWLNVDIVRYLAMEYSVSD